MARQIAGLGRFGRFLSRVGSFVRFLFDPDTHCLLRLAWQNSLKNPSRSAAGPAPRKKSRTRAAKAS
jgi:hypothetical protein